MKSYSIGQIARQVSRELRNNPTDAEKLLWKALRNRQFLNLKFFRQHPVFYQYNSKNSFFIADFYCHEIKMVIELDGNIHQNQKDYDHIRTEILEFKNIFVVRFSNKMITKDLDHSLNQLQLLITPRKHDLKNIT